jgi:hypothetical protein
MDDPARCVTCHETVPERGRDHGATVTFKDSIVALCSTCHTAEHYREEHPVELRPEFAVPDDLPLDNAYSITCATCHDPHGPAEADRPYAARSFWEQAADALARRTRFPTRFLRRPNPEGELCLACHRAGIAVSGAEAGQEAQRLDEYVGSGRCRECHAAVWEEWSRTLHAVNFRDTRKEPGAVRAVFGAGGAEPFPKADVTWSVGEHWTQRYLIQGKKELLVVPDTWSLQANAWMKEGSLNRPWLKYCAGCHVTRLNPFDGTFLEAGTGCEGCHGPGRRHAESTDQSDIVNPAVLVQSRADMICEACHTAGHDRSGTFRFPVGYRPGANLMDSYRGLVPKPGQDTKNYTGDGSYEDRHRQFLFWVSRVDILVGVTCDVCSADRRAAAEMEGKTAEYRLTPDEQCGTCHHEIKKDQQRHSGHRPASAGCVDCHRPRLSEDRTRYSIHDHKFRFGAPSPEDLAGGDPCEGCHQRRHVRKAAAAAGRGGAARGRAGR